ncbi:MAG: rod shape-determining protein MreD [Oceanospirillaceae bacterium]|nr:rod shape-determining protein MreD [Oceanospirillaceae bacterium]|tara:strand:- start:168 stop:647 length:480 start_codon:yes stop_codon:yes gene_type:complete
MDIRAVILALVTLFIAFVLEHMPMPEILLWLQPSWVLLVATLLVLNAPSTFGLWLALPLGLMLDVEHHTLLGTHILSMSLHIFILQILYRRMMMFNFLQQTGVIFLLVGVQQLLVYWSVALVSEQVTPVSLWTPALTSALVWPWVYALGHAARVRLNLR